MLNRALMLVTTMSLCLWACTPDACKDVNCLHGICDSGECACDEGFEGLNCEVEHRMEFVGSYAVVESCEQGTFTYIIEITANSDNATELVVLNIGDFGFEARAVVNGNTLQISDADVNGATLNANGELAGELLTIGYTLQTTSGQTLNCTMNCNRL